MSWKKLTLADCCEIVSGATPSTTVGDYWGGDICWATPKDLSNLDGKLISDTPRKLTKAGIKNCSANILPIGSVLFSSRAPIGHVAINTVPMATNQGFKSFVVKQEKIDANFLYHWLLRNKAYIENLGNGATFKEVSKAIVGKIEILLPPLSEQRRIANILDCADALRTKRYEAIEKINALKQAIFLEMFGDPVTNPKGEKIVQLSQITTRITDGVHQKPNYTESGVPFISVKDITTGKLIFDDCKYISIEDHQKYTKRCKAEYLDILYTKVGATYGRPALVDVQREFSLYVSVCLIKPNKNLVDPHFLVAALGTTAIKAQADSRIKGIGVPDLHLDQIQKFLLPLPSMQRQQEFANRINKVIAQKNAADQSLLYLEDLFKSLQHRAFNGEL